MRRQRGTVAAANRLRSFLLPAPMLPTRPALDLRGGMPPPRGADPATTAPHGAAPQPAHEALHSREPPRTAETGTTIDAAHAALRRNDATALQALVSRHPELLTTANRRGETLLSAAINTAPEGPMVATLLAHAAGSPDVMAKMLAHRDFAGDTPLARAIAKGSDDLALLMLQQCPGIDVNAANARQETLLHLAARHGCVKVAQVLLSHPQVAPSLPDAQGDTPLHIAVRQGDEQLVRHVAKHPGALPTQANRNKEMPLFLAISMGRVDLLAALMEGGKLNPNGVAQAVLRTLESQQPETTAGMLLAIANRHGSDPGQMPTTQGRTLLTYLCSLPERRKVPTRGPDGQLMFVPTGSLGNLVVTQLMKSDKVNVNATDQSGDTAFAVAMSAGNFGLADELLRNKHFDRNALTPFLLNKETSEYARISKWLHPQTRQASTQEEHKAFLREALESWVDQQDPKVPGGRQPHANRELAIRTNLELGRLLVEDERAAAGAGAGPSSAPSCARDAVFRLTLALDLCLEFTHAEYMRTIATELLAASANKGIAVFNLGGTPVSRNEAETWAAGRLPPAIEKRSLERAQQAFQTNATDPHGLELRSRGNRRLEYFKAFTAGGEALTPNRAFAAIEQHVLRDGMEPPPLRKIDGLKWVNKNNTQVSEGLNITPKEALATTWGYVQAQPPELRGDLSAALMNRLVDIGRERPCPTGIVQRILDTPNGIDMKVTTGEPDAQAMRQEMLSIAGKVNEHIESEYVTPEEDDAPTIGLKKDMVRAAVEGDLVGRRGWDPKKVEPVLGRVLDEMDGL